MLHMNAQKRICLSLWQGQKLFSRKVQVCLRWLSLSKSSLVMARDDPYGSSYRSHIEEPFHRKWKSLKVELSSLIIAYLLLFSSTIHSPELNRLYNFGQCPTHILNELCYWQWYSVRNVYYFSPYSVYCDALRHSSLGDPFAHKPIYPIHDCIQYYTHSLNSLLTYCKYIAQSFQLSQIELLYVPHALSWPGCQSMLHV